MIDASVDRDFAAFERQESLKEVRPSAADAAPRVYRGKLAALAFRPEQTGTLLSTPTPSTCTSAPPPDPLEHLRAARLGFAAAVILVLYWLWIRQKRKR